MNKEIQTNTFNEDVNTFEELNLKKETLQAVKKLGFEKPTPIQSKCIPELIAGHDVVGQSFTGSGKTAAFGLPLIEKIDLKKGIQALILTPTRELCVQVQMTLETFAKFSRHKVTAIYGGASYNPQISALKEVEIVVATPGRLLDHMQQGTIKLNNVKFLVLDEADKMFEMGFVNDVEKIMKHIPKNRQTALFSATMPSTVTHLIKKHLKNPSMIKAQTKVDNSLLKQVYFNVEQHDKFSLLVHLIKKKTGEGLAIVFCATRHEVDALERNLRENKIHVMAVHGGLSQNKRLYAVNSLKREHIQILVATDVAARGLDINNITHIYNYDVSKTSEEYIHRIGRTARAGNKGEAVTLLTQKDYENFSRVLSDRTIKIYKETLPEFEKLRFVRNERSNDRRPHQAGGPRSRFGSQRSEGRRSSEASGQRSGTNPHRSGGFKPHVRRPRFGSG